MNELWLKIGQSNSAGNDKSSPILHATKDRPFPYIYEVSQGIDKPEYKAAPPGELHLYRHPGQDTKRVSLGLEFAKSRYRQNPWIQKIAMLNYAKNGTGFSNNYWNPGDPLFESAMSYMELALEKNPELVPAGILWHGGEIDAGMTQADYQSKLSSMVSAIRGRFGQQMVFVVGTMVESWISGKEADRRPIDLAHRNAPNYIDDSAVADLSDLTDLYDFLHFSAASLRIAGSRYAAAVPETSKKLYHTHQLKAYDSVVDVFSGFGDENSLSVVDWTVMGMNSPTGMTLNPNEYTISGFVKFDELPTGQNSFISGKNFKVGIDGVTHGASNSFDLNLYPGIWAHIKITFKNTKLSLFIDGEWVGDSVATDQLEDPIQLVLGSEDFPVYFKDLTILPRA